MKFQKTQEEFWAESLGDEYIFGDILQFFLEKNEEY
jgi:hypothetical protein